MNNIIIYSVLLLTSGSQIQNLEKAYWDCDYISTTRLMSSADASDCSLIYEKLLKDKFNGEFAKFLLWWKDNKELEYKLRDKKQN